MFVQTVAWFSCENRMSGWDAVNLSDDTDTCGKNTPSPLADLLPQSV